MHIYNNDKDFFRKCIEIWDKIIELIGINNPIYFFKADDDDKLFIMADGHENTSFLLEDNYRYGHNKVVTQILIHINKPINHIDKNAIKIYNRCMHTQIIIKKFLLFFFTVYKNEQKEHKF